MPTQSPLVYNALTEGEYRSLTAAMIKTTEGFYSSVYMLADGKATIGYGYTLNRDNNAALFSKADITLSDDQAKLLVKIDEAPASQKTKLASTLDIKLTTAQATSFLEVTLPEYEGPAKSLGMYIAPDVYSREMAAFVSLTWNRGVTAVTSKMQPFYNAMKNGNRAEA